MDDCKIIDLYFERREEAIRESDTKYGQYCRSIAYHILHNAEDTEECVNDTWMKAWNAIPPTRPNALKAFLGKITRNVSLNHFQKMSADKRGGTEVVIALEELSGCIPSQYSAEQAEDLMALTELLNQYLASMEREKRIIFVKRYWYMEPVRQISEEMGISESNVKMSLLRARKGLQEALEKAGVWI